MRKDILSGIVSSLAPSIAFLERAGRRISSAALHGIANGLCPSRCLSVSVERGGFSIASASKLLGRVAVRYTSQCGNADVATASFIQPEVLSTGLLTAISELRRPKGARILLVIPTDWVFARTVELPLLVKENLEEVVAQELDRLTPLTSSEAYYDYTLTGEDSEKLYLSIYAARKDTVDPYIRVLEGLGLKVGAVSFGLAALASLCSFVSRHDNVVFLGKEGDNYGGGLIAGGRLVAASVADGDGTPPVRLLSQVLSSTEAHRKRTDAHAVVTACVDKADLPAVETAAGAKVLSLSRDDIEGRLRAAGSGEELPYTAIGASVAGVSGTNGIDLGSMGRRAKDKPDFLLPIALALLCLGLTVPYMLAPLQTEKGKLDAIETQIKAQRGTVKKVEAIRKEADALDKETTAIESFKEKRAMSLGLLKELTETLPRSVWLMRVRITETSVEIEGYAASASEVLPKLEQSRSLKKVEFASPTVRDQHMGADRFSVKAEIEGLEPAPDIKKGLKDEKKK